MTMNASKTAKYKIIADAGGNRYKFFCAASGMALCVTRPIRAETQEDELRIAWESEGELHFNKCACCGRYVSDTMYNADVLRCVECTPWEEKPRYCARCGKEIRAAERYCADCGRLLRYGEAEVV